MTNPNKRNIFKRCEFFSGFPGTIFPRYTVYTFDEAGNREKEEVTVGENTTTTIYTYNEQNRLTKVVIQQNGIAGESVVYTYDNNGNMIYKTKEVIKPLDPTKIESHVIAKAGESQDEFSKEITLNKYDGFNRLIDSKVGSHSVSYKYNGEGLRVYKQVNDVITSYLYEGDKVILEIDGTGNQIARNVHGINQISRIVDSETAYYMYNGHADVTALIGSNGVIFATYYYDAFGNPIEELGEISNPYRYAGYQYDSETGYYYLQSRYYDPRIARFLSEDTYKGHQNDPLSLNYYTYCSNNPIIYVDPTGHWQRGDEYLKEIYLHQMVEATTIYFNESKERGMELANKIREKGGFIYIHPKSRPNHIFPEYLQKYIEEVNKVMEKGSFTKESWNYVLQFYKKSNEMDDDIDDKDKEEPDEDNDDSNGIPINDMDGNPANDDESNSDDIYYDELADELRQAIIDEALKYRGEIPYHMDTKVQTLDFNEYMEDHNGDLPPYMDCADFTSSVYYTVLGIKIGVNVTPQRDSGISIKKSNAYDETILKIGDLLIFDWNRDGVKSDHVGIYIGNGKFIHESGTNAKGGNVKVFELTYKYKGVTYWDYIMEDRGIIRVIQDDGTIYKK